VKAPEGFEHLDQEFWDRVEIDPDSDCYIYQTEAANPSYNKKTLLSYLMGTTGPQRRHRACFRKKCVNADHLVNTTYNSGNPPPRRTGRGSAGKVRFSQWYSQC
jgi:hypothetical protein